MEVVRRLDLSDIDQMLLLRVALQKYDMKYMVPNDSISEEELIKRTRKYFENSLNKSVFMFGLFIDNELVANSGFYLDIHLPAYDNPSGYIGYMCNVFTKKEYRRKGYQKKVFSESMKCAKQMGITKFKLNTRNQDAMNMYRLFGFLRDNGVFSLNIL